VAPGLEVSAAIDGPHLVIALHGEIDTSNVDAFHAALCGMVRHDSSIRVDLSRVTFLDSSLLRALLASQAQFARAGVDFKVRNPTQQARRIFEVTNLSSLLD